MAAHLVPLSENFTVTEFVVVFVVASFVLTLFLFFFAGILEMTNSEEYYRGTWREKRWPQIRAEMKDSLSNPPCAVLATMLWDVLVRPHTPAAEAYAAHDAPIPGWDRIVLETLVVFFAADMYIYFEHRLMHTSFFYARVHKTHHLYHVPTSFAGFANHPLEAVFFTLGSLWIQLFVAIHPLSHGIFGVFGAVWTILSHDDRSVHDSGFHYQHHFNPNTNFGAFTTFWDNLFQTRWVNPAALSYREEVVAKKAVINKSA